MTLDFTSASIKKLIIHAVGNKLKEEEIILSQECVDIEDSSLSTLLGKYFFQCFKDNGLYNFGHITDLRFNEVYQYIKSIFIDFNTFETHSKNIAKQLYEASTHPNIKKGELCVAFIKGVSLNEIQYDAVGIFKSENKDSFLRINRLNGDKNGFAVTWERGIDTNKLDKGCIILNNQMEKGYKILLIDSGSSTDTKYWVEDFLGIQKNNNFNKTKMLVEACKEFTKKDFLEEKTDKVAMLNNVVEYFKSNSNIELDEFTSHVAKQSNRSEELKEFINDYAEKKECQNINNFFVDKSALKNIRRSIKNFIKLDTDFEIKINGSSGTSNNYLEKGYDSDKQMYFYKIYFNEEK